jgi:N-acetylmuramoyl-L-alanine amidase
MSRSRFLGLRSSRRTPLLKRWWGDLVYRWQTGARFPLLLMASVIAVLAVFSSVMHAMVANDSKQRDLNCLAMNVYHEARGEPLAGQFGVAEVTMNRVADSRYPDSVCEVVYQKRWDYLRKRHVSAFSWTEFETVDVPEGEAWQRAVSVAEATLNGEHPEALDGAVYYHAAYIRPSWTRGKQPVAKIGRHVFYR